MERVKIQGNGKDSWPSTKCGKDFPLAEKNDKPCSIFIYVNPFDVVCFLFFSFPQTKKS